MKRIISIIIFLLLTATVIWADVRQLPSAHKKEYYSDGFFVSASNLDYSPIAREVVGDAFSSYDKARAIYLWLCDNIAYDPTLKHRTADDCWRTRKAVCQGYCELFFRMGETVGLKSKLINGYGKHASSDELEKHVWLAVQTEEGEILLDPTWGAGLFVNGKFVKQQSPMLWFATNPHWFIFTHYPQKKKHQHLDDPVEEKEFRSLPYLNPVVAKLGIVPREALARSRRGEEIFPLIPILNTDYLSKVSLSNVPLVRHLKLGKPYLFEVDKIQKDCKILLENEGNVRIEDRWECKDGRYSTTVVPKTPGRLRLIVTSGSTFVPTQKAVLEYIVEK